MVHLSFTTCLHTCPAVVQRIVFAWLDVTMWDEERNESRHDPHRVSVRMYASVPHEETVGVVQLIGSVDDTHLQLRARFARFRALCSAAGVAISEVYLHDRTTGQRYSLAAAAAAPVPHRDDTDASPG